MWELREENLKKKKIPIDTIEMYNNLIAVRTINTHAHSTSGILEF